MSNPNNQHYIVANILGNDPTGLLEALSKISKQCGCNILESKLSYIGEECALLFHFLGSWDSIAKLEINLPFLCQQLGAGLQMKRTLHRTLPTNTLPYQINVTAHDRIGILNELAYFLLQHRIEIDRMECETYTIRNNSKLANLTFFVNIPTHKSLPEFRERLITYCDDRNLDVVIEACRY